MKLLHNLDQICVFSLEPDLDVVLQFVIKFQKSRPDLVARSHLQVPYYNLIHLYLAALYFPIPIHHFISCFAQTILAVVALKIHASTRVCLHSGIYCFFFRLSLFCSFVFPSTHFQDIF